MQVGVVSDTHNNLKNIDKIISLFKEVLNGNEKEALKYLKELINDYVSSSNKVLAKIIVDHKSPFLKSIIIKHKKKIKNFSIDLVIRQIVREIINEMVKDIIITTRNNIQICTS